MPGTAFLSLALTQRDVMRKFLEEIKRRNVSRGAIVYRIAGWLTMQVVDVMFPALNRTTLIILIIAVAFLLVDKFVLRPDAADTMPVASSTPVNPSVAVLPFVNMSRDVENEYFSDGLSEELLNLLAKIRQLRVAGRTSSFKFKGQNEDLRLIGEQLTAITCGPKPATAN